MITATSRGCTSCGRLLPEPPAAPVCSSCGVLACVPLAEWPAGAKRFLTLLTLADAVAMLLEHTEQARWEWILRKAIRGRWYGARLVPHTAPAADCFPVALRLVEAWEAAGRPTDFASVARIRGETWTRNEPTLHPRTPAIAG